MNIISGLRKLLYPKPIPKSKQAAEDFVDILNHIRYCNDYDQLLNIELELDSFEAYYREIISPARMKMCIDKLYSAWYVKGDQLRKSKSA